MHILITNLYFYMEAQMCTCVWNVLIPNTTVTLPKPTVARRSVSQKWENRATVGLGNVTVVL